MTEEQTELVKENIRLVRHIIKRYENSGVPIDDLMSAGYYGLCKAANTYKTDRNTKFSTYAGICITNSLLDTIDDYHKRRQRYTSIDEPVYHVGQKVFKGVGDPPSHLDVYDDGERLDESILQQTEIQERKLILGLYLIDKSPRYAQIIRLRLKSRTHEAIANEIGISKSYISRILTRIEKELAQFKKQYDQSTVEFLQQYTPDSIERAKRILLDPLGIKELDRSALSETET